MADKELWEIELQLKTQKFEEAHKKYESTLKGIHESEKRLTAAIIAEEKRTTAAKISETRLREAGVKAELNKELIEHKNKNAKELIDYKQALAEKNRLQKEAAAQMKAQQKADSKLTGQSVELGSVGAITQQISYYKQLRDSVNTNSKAFGTYSQKVNELSAQKKALIGTTSGLTQKLAAATAGYISLGIATSKAIDFTKQSIQAYAEDELALRKLELGLQRLGQGDYLSKLIQQQTLLQATTFFSDTQIANAQAMLTSFKLSGKEIEILTPRLLDMATQLEQTGQGTADLQQLAIQLGKATGGELVGGLKRYGVIMTDAQEKQLELAKGMERTQLVAQILDENFSGLATNMQNTTAFSINYMTQALGELKEGFGSGLVSNINNTGKSAEELAADLETVKQTGSVLAKLMSGRWVLDFQKWQTSLHSGIGDTLLSWVGLRSEMEVPITPSVSLELVDNAIQNIRNRYNQWLGDRHFAKEPEANSGTKTKDIGSKNSGSKTTKTLDEELNLIKLQEAEYKKLQAQYDKNIGDLGAQNDLRYKMLEIEREIFRLRYGADISLKNLPDAKNLNMDNIPGLPFDYTKMKHKYADGVDPRPDMTSEEFQAMIAAEEEKGRMMLANTSAMWENFQGMLQSTGLMKGDFAEIINIINSIITGGKSAFGFFDALGGLLGFLPGGGAVSSVIGG